MIEILLTQNQVAIIDDEDYELVSKYKWCAIKDRNTYYAQTHIYKNGKRTTRQMHQVILSSKKGQQVDHINGNGVDNRKENLRFADYSQNQQNKKAVYGSSSYKGVSRVGNRWKASIGFQMKNFHLGYFSSEEEAALTYNRKATELFGEFASINFIGTHLYKKDT
jgi:hypothetical protein